MIIVAPAVTYRIARIITVDSTGDERFWDPHVLAEEHPELFQLPHLESRN